MHIITMKPIKNLLLLLLCFCGIIGVVSADHDGGGTTSSNSRYDISENHSERKTKATSDHLRSSVLKLLSIFWIFSVATVIFVSSQVVVAFISSQRVVRQNLQRVIRQPRVARLWAARPKGRRQMKR